MHAKDITDIARAWWEGVRSEDWEKTEALNPLVDADPEVFPTVLAALVLTAPSSALT